MHKKFFNTLFRKAYLFRRITTFSLKEFNTLVQKLEPEWNQREYQRLLVKKRKNKVGQGRSYELKTFANLVLVTILYLRTSMGYELLGLLVGIDQSTVRRVVKRVTPLLTDRFIPNTALNKHKQRTNNLDELLKDYPELEEVVFDGTELPVNRPKKRQKQSYSGKKKRHTKKSILVRDKKKGLIVGLSPPKKGKIHDKKQLEQAGWDDKLPDDVQRFGDLGYFGMNGENWHLPHKKPKGGELTKQQKRKNKKHAKGRIGVEHNIRGMKIFRRIGGLVTIRDNDFLYNTLLASANLANFKVLVRQGIG